MNIIEAFGRIIDTLKKYNDSRYVKYDEISSNTDYKTPQDYGAGGKGFTDDVAAINQAIAENDVVYIPKGTYKINSPIRIDAKGKKIYGTIGTKIIAENCNGFEISEPSGLTLSDILLIGDKANNTDHNGIVINRKDGVAEYQGGGYNCHFLNLNIQDFAGDAFRTDWGIGGFGVCTIEKCKFQYCGNGIICLSDAGDQRNDIKILHNIFNDIDNAAIRITGTTNSIEGNNIERCEYGIRIDNWDGVIDTIVPKEEALWRGTAALRIVGNHMESCSRAFISLASSYWRDVNLDHFVDAKIDGVVIENNYAAVSSLSQLSSDFAFLEFVTYATDLTSEGYNWARFEDVTFVGNVFINDKVEGQITAISGNDLLTESCYFLLSGRTMANCNCIGMGQAVVIKTVYLQPTE